jgi:hypothetical protein
MLIPASSAPGRGKHVSDGRAYAARYQDFEVWGSLALAALDEAQVGDGDTGQAADLGQRPAAAFTPRSQCAWHVITDPSIRFSRLMTGV